MKKILIQVFLFLIVIIIGIFTYQQYFKSEIKVTNKIEKKNQQNSNNSNNLIKNLKYNVKFENNTEYSITSELSEIIYINNIEMVQMQSVTGIFKDKDGSTLKIVSKDAKYNNSTYNTIFENKVKIVYMDHIIESEKLFLDFEKNIVMISENIVYEGLKGLVKTDNIKIDLVSKNVDIFMNDNQNKIEINTK